MLNGKTRLLTIILAIVVLLACVPLATPIAPPPTYDLLSINTNIARTAEAAATQTALMIPPSLTPTVTAPPTKTLAPTETSTPIFIFQLPTATVPSLTPTTSLTPRPAASQAKYECRVDSQSPQDNHAFGPGDSFDAHWWVTNIGSDKWDSVSADYIYSSGDKIHKTAIYDLQKSIPSGKQAEIVVDMKAPNNPGTYTTTWTIRIGSNVFCPMDMTIIVK